MVNSSPLLRKRIVKKYKPRFIRFESDTYRGTLAPAWRRPRGTLSLTQVSTTGSGGDSRETGPCPKSVMALTAKPSITSPTVSRNSWSRAWRISTFCWWTTGPSAPKSPTTSRPERKPRSWREPSKSGFEWPTPRPKSEPNKRSLRLLELDRI